MDTDSQLRQNAVGSYRFAESLERQNEILTLTIESLKNILRDMLSDPLVEKQSGSASAELERLKAQRDELLKSNYELRDQINRMATETTPLLDENIVAETIMALCIARKWMPSSISSEHPQYREVERVDRAITMLAASL